MIGIFIRRGKFRHTEKENGHMRTKAKFEMMLPTNQGMPWAAGHHEAENSSPETLKEALSC